jgi:hypothetical protein
MRRPTNSQLSLLSQYFSDLSKILFGASVVGYFFPTSSVPVTLSAFLMGSLTAAICLLYAIRISAELTTSS